MSSANWSRAMSLCGLLLVLPGLLSWPLAAADAEPDPDVDLTLSGGGGGFTNSVGMKLVRISGGKFMMGAPDDEPHAVANERPRHQVEITRDFYLGTHEVTQKVYAQLMDKNPSYFSKDGAGNGIVQNVNTDAFPVESVSWLDAQAFIKKLNALPAEKKARRTYRLPTEAEWEYACRTGADVKEAFTLKKPSASLSSAQANFDGNQPFGGGVKGPNLQRPCKVGSYEANPFGLYDMHGNILEWCEDWYGERTYSDKDRWDPKGPNNGQYRMLKGGSFAYSGLYCRTAYRNYAGPDYVANFIGFRVACVVRQD
jgi:formylglycine-generating enzyme required for sulfatase activity